MRGAAVFGFLLTLPGLLTYKTLCQNQDLNLFPNAETFSRAAS